MRALALALLLTRVGAAPPGAVEQASRALAGDALPALGARRLVALAVIAPGAEALAPPVDAVLSDALARGGVTLLPLSGPRLADPESAAKQLGADWLLRVRVVLASGELLLEAELLPTWENFFLQSSPARPAGAAVFSARVGADRETLLLANAAPPPASGPMKVEVRPLLRLDAPALALAVGDVDGDGKNELAVLTTRGVALVKDGRVIARRELLDLPRGRDARDVAGSIAVGNFGGGRVAYALSSQTEGAVFAWEGPGSAGQGAEREGAAQPDVHGALAPAGTLRAAPLCASGDAALYGTFVPGTNLLCAAVADHADPPPPPGAPSWTAVGCPARPGRIVRGLLAVNGDLQLVTADARSPGPRIPGVGAGFALADLDGDGVPEVVASDAQPGPLDHVRVFRLGGGGDAGVAFESPPLAGPILAGAAGDLTGDGRDDAVLAAPLPSGETQLYLVTAP